MVTQEVAPVADPGRTRAPRVLGGQQASPSAPPTPAPAPSASAGAGAGAGEQVSTFFRTYAGDAGSKRGGLWRQVPAALAADRAARSLPVLTVDVSAAPEGELVRAGLAHLGRRTAKTAFLRTALHEVASVLVLPEVPHQYATGHSKQTVRRKSRAAEKAGVRWARVDDVAERRALVALSEERERQHPQERYRAAQVDNSYLLGIDLWLVAYSREGVPLLVCVVPTDGDWALLTYFRTLDDSRAASDARYLMSAVLAEELVGRGVRYLADTLTMSNLSDGLRHFQHMLGYEAVRVRLGRRRARVEGGLPATSAVHQRSDGVAPARLSA